MQTSTPPSDLFTRAASITPSTLDREKRTVEVTWTTGAAVRRRTWDGEFDEVLSLEPGAVRLDRLNARAPVLDMHSGYSVRGVLGAIVPGTARIESGVGRATLKFSRRADVEPILQDIEDEVLGNVSVGYRVYKASDPIKRADGTVEVRALDWEPWEISLASMPLELGAHLRADHSCPMCAHRGATTPTERPMAAPASPQPTPTPPPPTDLDAVRAEGALAENERLAAIRETAGKLRLGEDNEVVKRALTTTAMSAAAAQIEMWNERARLDAASEIHGQTTTLNVGRSGDERLGSHALQALLRRCDPAAPVDPSNALVGLPLPDLARAMLEARGVALRGLSTEQVVKRAMRVTGDPDLIDVHLGTYRRSLMASLAQPLTQRAAPAAISTSDLPLLVGALADTVVLRAYMQAPPGWERLVARTTLPDGQVKDMYKLGEIEVFKAVPEGGQIPVSSFGENRERWQISKYGVGVPWTYELMLADRLDVLGQFASKFGARARLNETTRFLAALRANSGRGPAMTDGHTFIKADHSNLVSGASIGAPSVTTVQATIKLLDNQTDEQGERIAIAPKFIVCSSEHELAVEQLLGDFRPTKASDVVPGRIKNLELVLIPELNSDAAPKEWYVVADPSIYDGVVVGNLAARPAVFIESVYDASRQSTVMYATHWFGVGFADHRAWVCNPTT